MSAAPLVLDAASFALLLAMLAIALFNLGTAPRLERAGEPRELPLVSVLVPARDEAANLRAHLPHLLASDYPRLEIIVLDDRSGDGTAAVAAELARLHPGRLRVVEGAPLRAGWLGKSWACDQLAREASGDVLLFCDADVAAGPLAVTHTVAMMRRLGAGALTALPRHRFGTLAEAAAVPLIAQLPVAATLPLWLVPRTAALSLSMGNGQWLAFTREAYDGVGGHAAVRGEVLEDVHLARAAKRAGFRLCAALATDDLSVRMYSGWDEVRRGFGKNVHALLGGRLATFAAGTLTFALAAVYPWMAALRGSPLALGALATLIAIRIAAAALFRHDRWTVLLHPVGALLALRIAAASFRGRGRVEWRGRTISVGADRGGAGGRTWSVVESPPVAGIPGAESGRAARDLHRRRGVYTGGEGSTQAAQLYTGGEGSTRGAEGSTQAAQLYTGG